MPIVGVIVGVLVMVEPEGTWVLVLVNVAVAVYVGVCVGEDIGPVLVGVGVS